MTREEKSRFGTQCERILDMLRIRPMSNLELARVALKYTSRISDLRKAGHDIRQMAHNRKTGVVWYELVTV